MKIVLNKPTITRDDLEGVLDCLIKDELVAGSTVKNFESAIANLTEVKYSLAANSLTSAYHLAFTALQINNNSEVIIPSFFNHAPLSALQLCRGNAVLVDNDENSLFPSIDRIKEKITEKTKCIVAGHSFGFHYDIDKLTQLNIPVIEDISHSIGTEVNEIPAGKRGAFAVASFAPAMILTTGNGGMVLTNNSKHYSLMRDKRGIKEDTLHLDYTMTDFQAAMGLTQLSKLKKFLKRRREIANIYYGSLRHTSHRPLAPYSDSFAYQSFPVLFDAFNDKIQKYWKKNGVEVVRPVQNPLHSLLGKSGKEYPNSDRMSKKLFTLPVYPTLTKKEIEKISKSLSSFI